MDTSNLKVAILHYWFVTWRGGERVVRELLNIFPNADIYTLFYNEEACGDYLEGFNVYSSLLDRPFLRKRYQKIFPLYPLGVKSLKLKGQYDLIISSESGPIKGVLNDADCPHICYVHTPMRYCWGFMDDYLRVLPRFLRPLAKIEFERLARYDLKTVDNVDLYLANSFNVKRRVREYYSRDADVLYPPISLDLFEESRLRSLPLSKSDYYLSFGALTPYKRIDLLVESFNASGRRLLVIGEGGEKDRLMAMAKPNIEFLGGLDYDLISNIIKGARALIFPGEEDFGMIPLEVMAHGVPVIAYSQGGALETVVYKDGDVKNSTGVFFDAQNRESIDEALIKFENVMDDFDPIFIRRHAREFGSDIFVERFMEILKRFMNSRF